MAANNGNIKGVGFRFTVPLLAGCTACLVYFVPMATSIMEYDRGRIGSGEIWRILTSHWTHWSAEHLIWDVVVFIVLLALSLHINTRETGIVLISASTVIPLGLYVFQPELICYRGLSGLDTALFAFVAGNFLISLKRKGERVGLILVLALLTGLSLKIAFEMCAGEPLFVTHMASNVIVVPFAHIIGAGIGFVPGLLFPAKSDSGLRPA